MEINSFSKTFKGASKYSNQDATPLIILISNDIYIHELQKKFLVIYKTIMVDAVRKLMLGERGYTQPEIDLPYFGKIKEEDK